MEPERKPESPVSITDIDSCIAITQNVLSRNPRSHSEHIIDVHTLAKARFVRYTLSQQKEDLDKSILHFTEAILPLPPVSRDGHSLNIVKLLFSLASALLHRSEKFEQPEDVKYSIEYLRYLRGLPLDSFDLSKHTVTTSLIQALGIQVKSEARDSTQAVNEMVDLCREFLSPNISADFPAAAFVPLGWTITGEWVRGRSVESLDKVVECLRDAVRLCPPGSESHPVLFALVVTLSIRFTGTHSNEDYEEGMALLERILDPNQPGECPESVRDRALFLASGFAFARSVIFQKPEYSEITISRLRTFLDSSSIDEPFRLTITRVLAVQNRERCRHYSLAESLKEANSYTSQLADLLTSQSLEGWEELLLESDAVQESNPMEKMTEKIQHLKELLSNTPLGTPQHRDLFSKLTICYKSKYEHTNDISDIEESIKYSRLSLDATPSSHPWRSITLASLRNVLLLAFKKTSKTNYLDESITIGYELLELKSARTGLPLLRNSDACVIYTYPRVVAWEKRGPPRSHPVNLSCEWAIVARNIGHPTTLTAYKTAMSLVQKSLSFAPTVSTQHTRLVAMGKTCQTMPLDYASFQIKLGRFEEAVETLEQGRALLWSEMRGLRTSMVQLIEEDPPLAKRYAEINQELEALTTSMITPSGGPEMEDGVAEGSDAIDPFGRLVVKQRKLVVERDALISQIRSRPGLERFVMTPSFSTLRSAASRGPVIVINHCEWCSDILIIFHNSLPCSIPTADDFYARANELRDELGEARKHGLDSGEYQDALCSVLKGLYGLIGKPVIKKLRLLGVPEQSRIWWCPTSVFCSLPLHAMGPIPSSGNRNRYFSDLYIPSYTPSLSALIESRNHDASPQMLDKPLLLLVAQPEDSLPGVKGEIKAIRSLEPRVTVGDLVSSEATPSSVVEGLRSSRFAHFACHGVLETGKPFDASFKLHGGSRLTLLDITRSRLPDAEFAFLSCCHAAEITEDSVADEALHLTAAMQYCGFRSVVGTMWEMADTDGRDLAKSFYKTLFSSQETSVPYYERSAGALRDATQKLRGKRGITLERWILLFRTSQTTEVTVPELAQAIPPSPHPSIDNQNVLVPTPTAPAPQPPLKLGKQTNADAPQCAPGQSERRNRPSTQRHRCSELSITDVVKFQFHDRPDVYKVFLDISTAPVDIICIFLTMFSTGSILSEQSNALQPYSMVTLSSSRVSTLFFLSDTALKLALTHSHDPVGDTVEVNEYSQRSGSTPTIISSTTKQDIGLSNTPKLSSSSIDFPTPDDHEWRVLGPAMEYVQRIKTRFSNDPDTHEQLEILSNKSSANNPPTGRELPTFSHFNTTPALPSPRRSGHSYVHHAPPPPSPQNYAQAGTAMALLPQPLVSVTNFDETQFFSRVKMALD
ncbi:CHAT domain-containing protein [Lactarius sanguifluus]|nr:CHAT domain-containing protein [Lactarius sanguifluus]